MLTFAVGLVLVAISGPPLWIAVPLLVVAAPIAVRTFVRLVPPGTLRLAPGMPAAVLVRGILTFAFFGADAYVSLTFQDVRDQPTWVAGVALTGATLGWTAAAWVQQRWILTAGPRRVVATGFAFLAVGIAGMVGALGSAPDRRRRSSPGRRPASASAWPTRRCRSPCSAWPRPAARATASSSIQLADVLGVALGTGLGGAFVALGEAQGWATRSALELAFPVTSSPPSSASSPPAASPPPSADAPRRWLFRWTALCLTGQGELVAGLQVKGAATDSGGLALVVTACSPLVARGLRRCFCERFSGLRPGMCSRKAASMVLGTVLVG